MSPEAMKERRLMRVMIIDDHTLFRRGLAELLERRGIEVVAAVGDGLSGIQVATKHRPDIILLDLRMPQIDGLGVLDRLVNEVTGVPVVMLTTSREERDLVEALRTGAKGYLLKDVEPDQLVASLTEVMEGNTVVAPDMTSVLARVVQGEVPSEVRRNRFSELTPRELEILCHLAEGQSNKAIARELGITDGTVKLHVRAILRKLRAHSRVEAAVLAVEERICQRLRTGISRD